MIVRCLVPLFLTATGFGQTTTKPPEYAKPLANERVWVDLSHNAKGAAILQVWFVGSESEIIYSDVALKAFSQENDELLIKESVQTDAKYLNLRFGKYKSDANFGFYTLEATKEEVAKVAIDWKGGHVEFAPVHRLKQMDFKPIHGGEAGVSVIDGSKEEKLLDVLLKGVMVPEVKYSDIRVHAFAADGQQVGLEPFFKERGNYILGSKEHGVFTGKYRIKDKSAPIARVTVQWNGEEIDFTKL